MLMDEQLPSAKESRSNSKPDAAAAVETHQHHLAIEMPEILDVAERAKLSQAIVAMLSHPESYPRSKPAAELPHYKSTDENELWAAEFAAQLEAADQYKAAGWPKQARTALVEMLTKVDTEQLPLTLDFGTYACGNWQDTDPQLEMSDYTALRSILGLLQVVKEYQQKGITSPVTAKLQIADRTDPTALKRNPESNLQFIADFRQLAAQLLTQLGLQTELITLEITSESENLTAANINEAEFANRVAGVKLQLVAFWKESEKTYAEQLDLVKSDLREHDDPTAETITWEELLKSPWNQNIADPIAAVALNFEYHTNQFLAYLSEKFIEKLASWETLPGKEIIGVLSPRMRCDLLQKIALSGQEFIEKPSYESIRQRSDLIDQAQDWLARQIVISQIKAKQNQYPSPTLNYTFAKPMTDQPNGQSNQAIALKALGATTQLDNSPWEQPTEVCHTEHADLNLDPTTNAGLETPAKKKKFTTISGRVGLSVQKTKPNKAGSEHNAKLLVDGAPPINIRLRIYTKDETVVNRATVRSMTPRP